MKFFLVAGVVGVGALWWLGGHSFADPVGSLSMGWSSLTGTPCKGCGAKTAATGAASTAGAPPGTIAVGF